MRRLHPALPARLLCCALIASTLAVAGCRRTPDEAAQPDSRIIGNEADPALTSALEDPILTDPALSQRSNRNAVRPADGPVEATYPPGSAASGRERSRIDRLADGGDCGARLDHSPGWARRMPAAFPVFPGARITDAAGNDVGDCRIRVVTFASDAPPQRVLDWYARRAADAGYTTDREVRDGNQILAGVRDGDDGAYYLSVGRHGRSGSDVALIANKGS